jgi:hypothetical protein
MEHLELDWDLDDWTLWPEEDLALLEDYDDSDNEY